MISQPSCPACGSQTRYGPVNVCVWEGEWSGFRCRDCRHRYHDPMPDGAELARMYTDQYYDKDGPCRPLCDGSYFDMEADIRVEARRLLAHVAGRGGRLLEIGCAGGIFLDEARHGGFDVTGLELNAQMSRHAETHFGLNVINKPVLDAGFATASFDVVVANRVLEHLPPIREVLGRLASWLKPGGVLLVSGPFEQTARSAAWYHVNTALGRPLRPVREPPYHVHGFTVRSWNLLLDAAGLQPTRLIARSGTTELRVRSWKDFVALPMEAVCWLVDRLTAGGDFMVAVAERPAGERLR